MGFNFVSPIAVTLTACARFCHHLSMVLAESLYSNLLSNYIAANPFCIAVVQFVPKIAVKFSHNF